MSKSRKQVTQRKDSASSSSSKNTLLPSWTWQCSKETMPKTGQSSGSTKL